MSRLISLEYLRSPLTHNQLYEQSRLASEVGAAVHMAPNANGLLRRWGLVPEDFGANLMCHYKELQQNGAIIKEMDLTGPNQLWQHPWQLVHRVGLHEALKKAATETERPGKPAVLSTASKVEEVDPAKGTITLADGTVVEADVILGADGIYVSIARFFRVSRRLRACADLVSSLGVASSLLVSSRSSSVPARLPSAS